MTVFVAGIHGVGKSFLCQKYAENFPVTYESASGLIRRERAQAAWSNDKKVSQIDDNQLALKTAVQKIKKEGESLLLDGHFVLINEKSEFVALESSVFRDLGILGVILLEAAPDVIASRLEARDSSKSSVDIVGFLQKEREQARNICESLNVGLFILEQPGFAEFSRTASSIFDF
ncbi:ATP-binding protein [Pseudomonas sp. GV071]|uniref:ATP-binding protein n=1 Tax=Pseudomonas sp. GV071 TaxID=2135754 RepID=UPI000D357430|nr:ATP-binding protein [Pseudomonas sp. GV071]